MSERSQPDEGEESRTDAGAVQDEVGGNKTPVVKRLEGFSPLFEFLVAISTVATLALLVLQTFYMRRSLEQTQESNELTRSSLAQARLDSDAAADAERLRAEEQKRFNSDVLAEMRSTNSETTRSNELSERSLQITQRARVLLSHISSFEPKPAERGTVVVSLKNTGQVPAKSVRAHVATAYGRVPTFVANPNFLPIVESTESNGILPRDQVMSISPSHVAFSDAQIKLFEGKELYFFVYGSVTYDDGFGQPRETTFCGLFNFKSKEWSACKHYNSAE